VGGDSVLGRGGAGVLVLTRKSSQSIMIGDDIEVSVLAVTGDKIRIGIEAPRAVPVLRREVYVERERMRRSAAASPRSSRASGTSPP
jgi:carbon storage regulator